jgi:hypothetical protein
MAKNKAKQLLMLIIGSLEMSILVMMTALTPLAFLYFLEKYLKTRLMRDLFLALLGFVGTIVSGLLFIALLVYLVKQELQYLGISLPLIDLDKAIKHILEQNEKQQKDK